MTIRSLDLFDLPLLPRYRQAVLALDTTRLLTRGNPLGLTALLSHLSPRASLYTALCRERSGSLMGQVTLAEGETSARLTFLAPAERASALALPLLDHLTRQAGTWGALHVLAEVAEDSPVFPTLRRAGFAMYAWQRAWRMPALRPQAQPVDSWRPAQEADWLAVQSLHAQIVPALLAPVESLPRQAAGWVCHGENGLQACVLVSSGLHGIWLQPLVLPDSACFKGQLLGLLQALGGGGRREVYVGVRSYQAWLENSLQEAGAAAGPRQAVMVKRLALPLKSAQPVGVMEKALGRAKPAAPSTDRAKAIPGSGQKHP